ncbi:hypothetical protein DFH08DRAFT_818695 [Mycena albidolilacea]|uniref:Bacteriophage T5 Orf172 DNA-binding domain-containing protein n=1 Tax=Mycena albidolilacea TaxID=1033008 RepID=A0AAD7EHE0_9AGAR|nr:hypothetical protein DFH08DRAFT_818695 [Mycena albidolilacea]
MYGAISWRGWRSPHLQSRLLHPRAPRHASEARIGVPKSCLQKTLPRYFCALPRRGWYPTRLRSRLLDPRVPRYASACPGPAPENTPLRIFRGPSGAVPGRGGTTRAFGALCSNPFACEAFCSPRALPDAYRRAQIPSPKTRRQGLFFATYSALFPDASALFPDAGALPMSSEPSPQAPLRLRSRLLAPSAPRCASACPSPTPKNTPPKKKMRPNRRCSRTRGHYPHLRSPLLEPPSPAESPACPERSQTPDAHRRAQIPPPKTHRQKKKCDLIGTVPRRGGTTRVFGALSSNPRSPVEPPACPEHSQTRIGVPKSHPQKLTANFFFCDLIGAVPGRGGHYPRLRSLPLDPPRFQPRLGIGGISKFALPAISAQSPQPGIHSDVYPPPSATTSARLPQQPSTTPGHDEPVCSQSGGRGRRLTRFSHQSNKAEFLTHRATRPYAKEGPGWCYNVACAADVNIAQHAAGILTDDAFLARMKWKVGHTNDWQRRQQEYRVCDVGKTHIWICGWEVSRQYYCERLAQLEELCDSGERATINCVCGVSHREYFSFTTVGGFTEFSALMTRHFVLKVTTPSFEKQREDKASVPCWPDPRAVPTKAIHWPDEDDVRVGFRANKGDVRVYFSADKGDVRAGSYADKGDVQLGLFTDKDDVLTKLHADKDSMHKARRGPSWGCHAGHGMGAQRAAA